MRKIEKEYEVEFLILKTFLKYVKEHNLHVNFRCNINLNNTKKDIYHTIVGKAHCHAHILGRMLKPYESKPNGYGGCSCYQDILTVMRDSNGGKMKAENTRDCQMAIMRNVNELVHNYIERTIRKEEMKVLEVLGGEVFNEVCTSLFGDGFEDKTVEMDDKRFKYIKSFKEMFSGLPTELMENGEIINNSYLKSLIEEELKRRVEVQPTTNSNRAYYIPWDFDIYDEGAEQHDIDFDLA